MTKKDANWALEEDSEFEPEDDFNDEVSAETENVIPEEYGGAGDDDNDKGWVDKVSLLPERERNELQQEIQPVKLALVKVSENRQCAPLQLTFQNLAAQACLQTHSLDYRTPPHMAQSAACIWPVHHQYATGCRYPVEFDLQHVEICAGPSGCNRHCNTKPRLRFAQV